MLRKDDFEYIGTIGKAHGIAGEVSAKLTVDLSFVYADTDDLFLMLEEKGLLIPYRVISLRSKTEDIDLLKFSGILSKEEAEKLTNMPVWLSRDYLDGEETPEDILSFEHYTGFAVYTPQGDYVGTISSVDDSTMNVLLLIETEQGELMLPIADELIHSLNIEEHKLYLIIPEGLLSGEMEEIPED